MAEASPRIVPRNPTKPAPLSFAQRRLWFLDQLLPGSTLYNISFATKLRFRVDPRALRRSLLAVAARHESMRTVFEVHDDEPVQVIREQPDVPLSALDIRAIPPSRRAEEARRAAARFHGEPFDLRRGPLVRALLIWLDTADYFLVIGMHHIVSDGWSLGVFAREIEACYAALAAGKEPDLPPLPVQYADFAVWQHESHRDVLDAQLEYWREQLGDAAVLELPTDRPRPPVQAHRGAEVRFALDATLVDRLTTLARGNGATLFMVTLAAFDAVLARWTGQDDLVVGVPNAGRPIAEVEPLIGFFVNTLVLRVDVSGAPTFSELVRRVRAKALAAYSHADVPFERLVEELRPPRDLSRNPIVQVIFQLFESAQDPTATSMDPAMELPATTALFDLRVDLVPLDGTIVGRCEYDTDLFERTSIERLCRRFVSMLEQVVENPALPITAYEQLDDADHAALVELEWGVRVGVPGWSVGELFGRVVGGGGDGVAVVVGGRVVSFGELDRCVGLVGERLVAAGVRAGVPVGVVGGVGLEQIVGGLAVLGLGAVWVPVDPELPVGRAVEMVADAAVAVAVVAASVAGWWSRVDPAGAVTAVVVDGAGAVVEVTGAGTPGVLADDAAWVLFTSGTSGRPKGVIGSTAGLVNRLWWWWRTIPYQPGDRAVVKTRPGFVDAIGEVLVPLLAGVPVVVADSADPAALAELVAAERVTHLLGVPSLLAVLYDTHGDVLARAPLRVITSSGEPLTATLAATIRATNGDATIVNLYGSTETSGDATAAIIGPTDPTSHVTIGRPIDNVTARILDHHGQLLPPGATGHLHIGGAALTHGYLPTVAADDHARYWHDTTQRWYATGDLARWRPDGTLEHLGRHDRQTKIRGVRVEPAGIEHTLITIDHITDAAVTTRHHPTRGTELTAYLVLDDPHHPLDHIRQQLRATLPTHHLPTHLIPTTHIPRTPTGKIDHHALTTTTTEHTDRPVEPPRSEVERIITDVFAETTAQDVVGRHDDFFADLGGHSLLATRAVARLRTALRREIPLALLFERPTAATLGELVDSLALASDEDLGPIPPVDRSQFRTDRAAIV